MIFKAGRTTQKPLWRTAWRRIRHRPLQYLLLVVGVALGVAMMVAVDVANNSASRAFQLSTDAIAGRTTHQLVGGPGGLDEALYARLRGEIGYSPAAPIVEGYLLGRDLGDQPLRLVGVDVFAEPPFRNYLGVGEDGIGEGIVPFLTQPGAIVITRQLAEQYELAPGDSTVLLRGGREFRMTLIGLLEPADDISREAMDHFIFCDIATAQEILGMHGRLSHIDLIVADKASLASIAAILPPDVHLVTTAARSNTLEQMTAAFELNLTALSLLALMVGMFLIYNSVSFSVIQRRPLFGILRCLGVTGGQILMLILFEGMIFGLIGALIGLGFGVLLGQVMVGLVAQTINDLYFVLNVQNISVSAWTLLKGLAAGVGVAVFASFLPALDAMRTTPQSNLSRSSLENRSRRIIPWLTVGGLTLIVIAVVLLQLPGNNLVIAFAGLFGLLFGMALLTPAITALLMKVTSFAGGGVSGLLGRMASRNIVRSISRTSVAIAALMVAVSVIIGVSVMISSFRGTVSQWLDNTFQADVYISAPSLSGVQEAQAIDPEVIALAGDLSGVRQVVTAHSVRVMAPQMGRQVELISVDGDVSGGNRRYLWKDGDNADLWDRLESGEGIMLSEPLFNRENMGMPPEPILLTTTDGPRYFPVLAIYYDYASDQGTIMIGQNQFREKWDDDRITSVALFVDHDQRVETVIGAFREQIDSRQDIRIQSNQSLRASALDIFDRTFAITAALQLLATVVAFIGVLSALMSLQLERARELGVLRATGMSLGQMWRLTFWETGLMGSMAGLLAIPVGLVLAWVLIYVINLRSFGWTMEMSLLPGHFLQAFIVALAAALLAGIFPALRLGRMDIARALRQD